MAAMGPPLFVSFVGAARCAGGFEASLDAPATSRKTNCVPTSCFHARRCHNQHEPCLSSITEALSRHAQPIRLLEIRGPIFVTATGISEVGLLAETLKSGERPISPQILCSSAAVNSRNLLPHQIFNLTQQEKNGSLRP